MVVRLVHGRDTFAASSAQLLWRVFGGASKGCRITCARFSDEGDRNDRFSDEGDEKAIESLVNGFLDDESSSLHLPFKSAEGVIARVKTNLPKARPKIDAAIKIKTRLDSKLEWRTFERTCPRIGWSIAWGRFFVKLML